MNMVYCLNLNYLICLELYALNLIPVLGILETNSVKTLSAFLSFNFCSMMSLLPYML